MIMRLLPCAALAVIAAACGNDPRVEAAAVLPARRAPAARAGVDSELVDIPLSREPRGWWRRCARTWARG